MDTLLGILPPPAGQFGFLGESSWHSDIDTSVADSGSRDPAHPFSEEGEGPKVTTADDYSVIALDKFIQATRDSGYKGTVSAISELVDNSLQALARTISILIRRSDTESENAITIAVLDNGHGMDSHTLRQSLRFGGSSRFDDRAGLGRFGMGLPNASLSQARRVEVYSWTEPGKVIFSYLDLDEIASGEVSRVPPPRRTRLPLWVQDSETFTGTLVSWQRCDRLDNRRVSTIEQKLKLALGRIFRYFLWDGVEIDINGEKVIPVDPLYVREPSAISGGQIFGAPLEYEVRVPNSNGRRTGLITVTFSELPVEDWHALPNEEKRRLGVTNGAGVSIVRGGREIDYGWFFLTEKRRENYDDWWRAEVRFHPELDELFGITHTKQQVRPQESLVEVLSPDLGDTARALNARVRQAHLSLKTRVQARTAENLAADCDSHLRAIKNRALTEDQIQLSRKLSRRHSSLREVTPKPMGTRDYRIVEDDLGESDFFLPILDSGRIVMVVNPKHRFYKQVYRPLLEGDNRKPEDLLLSVQLLLLSAARAEVAASSTADRRAIAKFRREWSEVLEVLLRP